MIKFNLEDIMRERNLSKDELAGKMGITLDELYNYEDVKYKRYDLLLLDVLCKILECQPGDLIEYRKNDDESEDVRED